MYTVRDAYTPKNFELGECEPDLFKAARNFRVPESRLELGSSAMYLWMSSTDDGASFIYPSRVDHVGIDEASGYPDVRFAILNPLLDSIRDVYGLFLNGHFLGLRNRDLPFNKEHPGDGQVGITKGYFATEAGVERGLASLEAPVIQLGRPLETPVAEPMPVPAMAEAA